MITRIVVAAIGLAVLLPSVWFGGRPVVVGVIGVAVLIGLSEYAAMAFPGDRPTWAAMLGLGGAAAFGWHGGVGVDGAVPLAVATLGSFVWVVFRPGGTVEGAADKVGRMLLGIAWVAGLLPFLLRIYDFGAGSTAFAWLLLALAISWLGDTGAYFAGRAFGRRKLYPLISPNKTVEGAIGGLLCAAGGVLVFRAVALPDLSVRDAVLLGVVGCTLGIVGDLAESLLKRTFGVKDSGRIMPGHGGLLDRIDAVMFVAPFVYAYVVWFTPLLGVR